MSQMQTAQTADISNTRPMTNAEAFEAAAAEAKSERYVIVYLIGGMLVLTTLISNAFGLLPVLVAQIPALIGSVSLAVPLFGAALGEIRKQQISSNTLASLAILAAIMSQMYAVAGSLAFILLVADQFVRPTAWGAQRAIEQLIGLTPDVARLVEEGVEREVPLEQIKVGPEAPAWTPLERAMLQATDELTGDGHIADGTWQGLAALTEKQRMHLVMTVGQYSQVSMMLNSFGVQLDDDLTLDPDLAA